MHAQRCTTHDSEWPHCFNVFFASTFRKVAQNLKQVGSNYSSPPPYRSPTRVRPRLHKTTVVHTVTGTCPQRPWVRAPRQLMQVDDFSVWVEQLQHLFDRSALFLPTWLVSCSRRKLCRWKFDILTFAHVV